MRSTSIRPVLTDGRPTGKDNAKVAFEHSEIVRWDHVPCSTVSYWRIGSDSNEITGRVLSECLLGDCGRPSNAQHCGDQTKTKEKAQLPFSFRPHLYTPQQELGYQSNCDVAYARKSYMSSAPTHCPNQVETGKSYQR